MTYHNTNIISDAARKIIMLANNGEKLQTSGLAVSSPGALTDREGAPNVCHLHLHLTVPDIITYSLTLPG